MEIIRSIVKSNKEPKFKEVAWLDTSSVPYRLKFYELDGWKIHQEIDGITTKLIEDDSGITRIEGSYDNDNKFNFVFYNIKGEKGDPLTFEDLTEEQKAELAKPGIEAVDGVKEELNNKITHGVNLLLGSDTTLLDNIRTYQMASSTIAGKQADGWWRVNIPNGTTDGEIYANQEGLLLPAGRYTFSCEIKSDAEVSAKIRFHAPGFDYNLKVDRIDELSEHHYRVIGAFVTEGSRTVRQFDIHHINAPNSTYIDIRFPMLSLSDDYVPWQPSIYDLTEMRQEVHSGGSSLDDAPSDGNTYGRKDGAWSKTVGKVDPNSDGTGEVFNDYTNNIATGRYSHAEGRYTNASGYDSHAEGNNTTASGGISHAEGSYTIASSSYSHAEGRYNLSNNGSTDADKSIHMVGIGKAESDRKNAHEIMTNGDHYIYGIGGYDGKNYSEAKTLQEVITELTTQVEALQTTINELKGGQE